MYQSMIIESLTAIFIIGGIIAFLLTLRHYSHKERMAMIEKGTTSGDFSFRIQNNGKWAIKIGLLAMGAGLGFLIGSFLDSTFYMEEVAYFSMLFLFGGLGLVVSHYLTKKEEEKDA